MKTPLSLNTTTAVPPRDVPVRVYESGSNWRIQRPRFASDPLSDKPACHAIGPGSRTTLAIYRFCPDPGESQPFTSEAGTRFRHMASLAGLYLDGAWRSHLIDRATPRSPDSQEVHLTITAQLDAFWSELRDLHARGVTTVLALGQPFLPILGITGTLDSHRGSIIQVSLSARGVCAPGQAPDLVFIPTYDIQAVMGGAGHYEKQGMKVDLANVMAADIQKAVEISETGFKPPCENFVLAPSIEELEQFAQECTRRGSLVACDIETTALQPHQGQIVVIGFAPDAENALCVPLLDKGGVHYWTPEQWPRVRTAVNAILMGCPLMFQNGYFDVYWLREKGFKVPRFAIKHDTLVLHHTTNPELDHDIGFIASIYAKTSYWKDVFKERKVPILQMDQEEMRRYNLRDCTVLHQVLPGLLQDLEEAGPAVTKMYREEAIPMIEVSLELHSSGVPFSEKRRALWEEAVAARVAETETKCRELGGLPPEFSLNSDMDMRVFLFGEIGPKYDKADLLPQKKPGTKLYRELQALDVVRNLKPLWMPEGLKPRRTKTGMVQVDEQGRLSLQVKAQNRLEALQGLKKPQPIHEQEKEQIGRLLAFLEAYGEFAEAVKLQETYVKWTPWPDSRVHSDWKSYGTATGRLASKGPNAQNWPKEGFGSGVRKLFEAPEGWCFISLDYANLEVGTMAYTSKEPNLIAVFEQGINLHDLNTKNLFGIDEKHPNWKMCRSAAKVFQFGIQYGGGVREIYEKINLKVPKLKLTYAEYSKCVDRYFASNPVYTRWRETTQATVKKTRLVITPFGRMRRFYGNDNDIVKEALNFPCQSAAASIINLAALRILRRIWAGGFAARLVLQIHDQLVFLAPLAEAKQIKEIAQEEMERPVDWNGEMKRFPTDPEAGLNFGELIKWADFEKEHING